MTSNPIHTPIPETPAELMSRARFRDRMAEEAFDKREHDWFKHHATLAEVYRQRADALRGVS